MGGTNYLLPVDLPRPAVSRQGEAEVRDEAVALDRLLERLGEAQARFVLAIIDACRNNPFPRAGGRALGGERGMAVQTAPPRGVFIVFSAGQNQTALDGLSDADPEPNSVFTRTFLPLMRQPGLRIDDAVRQARQQVHALAAGVQHEQDPAFYDQTDGDFYFVPAAAPPPVQPPLAVETPGPDPDSLVCTAIRNSTNPAAFEEFPAGRCASFARVQVVALRPAPAPVPSPPEAQPAGIGVFRRPGCRRRGRCSATARTVRSWWWCRRAASR